MSIQSDNSIQSLLNKLALYIYDNTKSWQDTKRYQRIKHTLLGGV